MNKYDALTRSQVCMALYQAETRLLRTKPGSAADRELRTLRTQLFSALQNHDQKLLAKWEKDTQRVQKRPGTARAVVPARRKRK